MLSIVRPLEHIIKPLGPLGRSGLSLWSCNGYKLGAIAPRPLGSRGFCLSRPLFNVKNGKKAEVEVEAKPATPEKPSKENANDVANHQYTDWTRELANKAYERSKRFSDKTYERSREFTEKTFERSKEFTDRTLVRSKKFTDKTIERSKQFTDKTLEKSKELTEKTLEIKENISKMIPPELHENIYTIPNILTFTRLVCAPLVGYMILHHYTTLAFFTFVYCCVTDFFDGLIARHWNLKSAVGSIIDPIADKALMIICTVCLSITSEIPPYLAVLILGRDLFLGLAGVIIRYTTLPAPKTLARYFDFSIITVEVHPAMVSKINTALQMVYLGIIMMQPFTVDYLMTNYGADAVSQYTQFIEYFEWAVALTTIWSSFTYLFSRNAVKYLIPPKK